DYGEGIGRAVYDRHDDTASVPLSLSLESNQSVGPSGETPPLSVEEVGLRLRLESFLSKAQGRVVQITGWSRGPSPFAVAGGFPAARSLAQFQAHFAGRAAELRARDYLLRLDAPYFHQWAGRALAVVAQQSAGLAHELAGVVNGYGGVAETLARQPVTLVHND